MIRLISRDDALDGLFARDAWIWLKAPVLVFLLWIFFLPGIWKVVLTFAAAVNCSFIYPCFLGADVTRFALWFMLVTQAAVLYAILWYVAYTFAYARTPGSSKRALGAVAALAFPLVIIVVPLLIGLVGSLFHIPFDSFWAYFDRWTPIASWRVMQ